VSILGQLHNVTGQAPGSDCGTKLIVQVEEETI